MDDADSPLDPISLWLPLPYRVLFLAILGVWLFALNLHYFHIVRIDVSPFLRYTRSASEPQLHSSVYQVALLLTSIFFANLFLFWSFTGGNPDEVQRWEAFPMMLLLLIVGVFVWPVGSWHKRGRWRFLRMLRRTIIGGLDTDLRFADILLADALTSYSKILGDAAMVAGMFLSGYSSTHPVPNRSSGGPYLLPCIIAIPSLCRLRQCIIEYLRATDKGLPASDRYPHLYNATKYASAFPVIIVAALERNYSPHENNHFTPAGLARSWYIAVIVNTLFSFYWDVTRDWGLTLFTSQCAAPGGEHPFGLRERRHFVTPNFYYFAIGIDFVLRFTWIARLSSSLDFRVSHSEGGIFALQTLEVLRRWVWLFFRVEKEFMAGKDQGLGGYVGLQDAEEGMMLNEFRD